MYLRERVYESVLRGARGALADGWGHGALRQALAGRRAALPHLRDWSAQRRGDGPLVLVHAPSVGEALMAQAIISALRAARPDVQVAFTFFSPSAERIAPRTGADVWSYLPWDVSPDAVQLLNALRPAAIGFVRTEIWPVLGVEAARRQVPTLLLNAVLAAGSSRLSPGARFLLGPAYGRLHAVGAVAEEDGRRFTRLGVPEQRIHITGDARFDQVASRIAALDRGSALLARLRSDRCTLVAGSTWAPDEDALIPALAALPEQRRPRLLLAPHQPSPEHLEQAEQRLRAAGLEARRLADVEERGGDAAVVLIDRVGVLADLYAIADLAYVGGGFGTAGLHSVVEPAALGVPVLYGPRHGNAREANELAEAGGGFVVDATSLRERLAVLLSSEPARAQSGEAAARFVRERLGGAAANAGLLAGVLPD